jgi:hypothetical protein
MRLRPQTALLHYLWAFFRLTLRTPTYWRPLMEGFVSEQLTLFESLRPEPEGLRYAADFVSPAIEKELIWRSGPSRAASPTLDGRSVFGWEKDLTERKLLAPSRARMGPNRPSESYPGQVS